MWFITFCAPHQSMCIGHDLVAGSLPFLLCTIFDRYWALQTGNTPQELQFANPLTYLPNNNNLLLFKLAQILTFVFFHFQSNVHLLPCIYNQVSGTTKKQWSFLSYVSTLVVTMLYPIYKGWKSNLPWIIHSPTADLHSFFLQVGDFELSQFDLQVQKNK